MNGEKASASIDPSIICPIDQCCSVWMSGGNKSYDTGRFRGAREGKETNYCGYGSGVNGDDSFYEDIMINNNMEHETNEMKTGIVKGRTRV